MLFLMGAHKNMVSWLGGSMKVGLGLPLLNGCQHVHNVASQGLLQLSSYEGNVHCKQRLGVGTLYLLKRGLMLSVGRLLVMVWTMRDRRAGDGARSDLLWCKDESARSNLWTCAKGCLLRPYGCFLLEPLLSDGEGGFC